MTFYEGYFFDLGVRLHRMVEDELKAHDIEAGITSKTDAEIDSIINHIMVNAGHPDAEDDSEQGAGIE